MDDQMNQVGAGPGERIGRFWLLGAGLGSAMPAMGRGVAPGLNPKREDASMRADRFEWASST